MKSFFTPSVRHFLLMLSFSVFVSESIAQDVPVSKFQWGVAIFPGISARVDREGVTGARPGLDVGLEVGKVFGNQNRWKWGTGLYLLDKGGKNLNTQVIHHHYYLHLPLTISRYWGNVYIGAGPAVEYWVASRSMKNGKENSYTPSTASFLLAGKGYLGYQWKLTRRTSLRTELVAFPSAIEQYTNFDLGIALQW